MNILLPRPPCWHGRQEAVRRFARFNKRPAGGSEARVSKAQGLAALKQKDFALPNFRSGRKLRDYQQVGFLGWGWRCLCAKCVCAGLERGHSVCVWALLLHARTLTANFLPW